MKVKISKTQGCRRVIEVVVGAQEINDTLEATFTDMAKKISAPGFRKGKVPRDIVERNYRGAIEEEALQRVVRESFHDALEELDIDPLNQPEVMDFKNDDFKKVTYKAQFDVRPEVKLKPYDTITLKKELREVSVTDAEVDDTLNMVQKEQQQAAQQKAVEEEGGAPTEGTEDGADPSAPKKLAEGELPPLDDEFAKQLGRETLAQLKEDIKNQLTMRKQYQLKMQQEEFIVDELIKRADFILPGSLVEHRRDYLANALQHRPKEDETKEKEFEKRIRELAERQIRVSFILEKISADEGIEHEKVIETLLERILKKD